MDPSTHQPVVRAKERIEFLIGTLYQSGQKIIIPTPVLAEILVAVPNPREVLQIIGSSRWYEIYPFDQKAAIECAEFIRVSSGPGRKKRLPSTWAKTKFDFQIIAIAIVAGADTIYTDDEDISRQLTGHRIKAVRVCQLPLPPPQQMSLYNGENPKE